jgi:hypothetical protein
MPRKALGDRPLTVAERSARKRARMATATHAMSAALRSIQTARTIGEAREIAGAALSAGDRPAPTRPERTASAARDG